MSAVSQVSCRTCLHYQQTQQNARRQLGENMRARVTPSISRALGLQQTRGALTASNHFASGIPISQKPR